MSEATARTEAGPDPETDAGGRRATAGERFARGLDRFLRSSVRLAPANDRPHDGTRALAHALGRAFRRSLQPPPELSMSEWADRFAYLSPENSAEPGKWQTIGYQKGMMDAITSKEVEKVTVKKSARVGYTKIIDHTIGYYAHQDPSPMMAVQPTIEDAKGYSTDEVIPMLRDTPVLSEIAISEKERGSGVTQLKRKFRNGASLLLVGANSPRGFRRVTIRVVLFDEVDGYPVEGAGKEGDQIRLGIKRTETFWNRKIIVGSTPTVKGASRVDTHFRQSDQRYYAVPCPHCQGRNILKFSDKLEYGDALEPPEGIAVAYMTWPKDRPEDAHFVCGHNGCVIEEEHKAWMIEEALKYDGDGWVATRPFRGHAGFSIWAAYSLFPNARWGILAREFVDCIATRDMQALQVFINTVLGELWEPRGERVDDATLLARREDYGTVAPRDAVAVTAGVDVQGNRIEVEKVAWGVGQESWGMGKDILFGDPTGPDIWQQLEDVLDQPVPHELGGSLSVMAAGVDSNYLTQTVTTWCQQRWSKRWWAIRGMAGQGRAIWPKKPGKTKGKLTQFSIGVDAAKELIYQRLKLTDEGPGYCHFNMDYDEDHFQQLTSEEVVKKYSNGLPTRHWQLKPGHKRNEGLDLRVYALAALEGLRLQGLNLAKRAAALEAKAGAPTRQRSKPQPKPKADDDTPSTEEDAEAAPVKRRRRKRRQASRSTFMSR